MLMDLWFATKWDILIGQCLAFHLVLQIESNFFSMIRSEQFSSISANLMVLMNRNMESLRNNHWHYNSEMLTVFFLSYRLYWWVNTWIFTWDCRWDKTLTQWFDRIWVIWFIKFIWFWWRNIFQLWGINTDSITHIFWWNCFCCQIGTNDGVVLSFPNRTADEINFG